MSWSGPRDPTFTFEISCFTLSFLGDPVNCLLGHSGAESGNYSMVSVCCIFGLMPLAPSSISSSSSQMHIQDPVAESNSLCSPSVKHGGKDGGFMGAKLHPSSSCSTLMPLQYKG
jgi:hypothetical protein